MEVDGHRWRQVEADGGGQRWTEEGKRGCTMTLVTEWAYPSIDIVEVVTRTRLSRFSTHPELQM